MTPDIPDKIAEDDHCLLSNSIEFPSSFVTNLYLTAVQKYIILYGREVKYGND
jgi:hypothetical protein